MKALTFLTKLKQSRDFDGNLEYSLDEAIAELEEVMNLTRAKNVNGILLFITLSAYIQNIVKENIKTFTSQRINDVRH